MTKEEILAMEAGKELDTLVEEKLFDHRCELRWCNWLPQGYFEVQSYGGGREVVSGGLLDENELLPCYKEGDKWAVTPFYSTDISATWLVVEKVCNWDVGDNMLILKGQEPNLEPIEENEKVGWWEAEINGDWGKVTAEGKIAPEAICKVALLTKYSTENDRR